MASIPVRVALADGDDSATVRDLLLPLTAGQAAAFLPLFCRSIRCLSWRRPANRNASTKPSLNIRG